MESFVFKMSKEKAEICVQMDRHQSRHPLSKEFCFLDAVHSRCQEYKTLTLWVWHPTLNELVNLAPTECETESRAIIQTFWNNLNEVIITQFACTVEPHSSGHQWAKKIGLYRRVTVLTRVFTRKCMVVLPSGQKKKWPQ